MSAPRNVMTKVEKDKDTSYLDFTRLDEIPPDL